MGTLSLTSVIVTLTTAVEVKTCRLRTLQPRSTQDWHQTQKPMDALGTSFPLFDIS